MDEFYFINYLPLPRQKVDEEKKRAERVRNNKTYVYGKNGLAQKLTLANKQQHKTHFLITSTTEEGRKKN